jgi:WD40 repeat protein
MLHNWIFLCYRRTDSAVETGRIFDALNARFPGEVFRDVESIDVGVHWIEELRQSVLSADVLVVVIGPEWQTVANERGVRIDDPADYVHVEVRTALEHDIRIIPVLLDGAQMPPPRTLPPRLEGLLRRQALPLRAATFDDDLERLTARLERVRTDVQHAREQIALRATAHEQQELSARRLAAYAESTAVKPRALPRAGLLALESMLRFPLPGAHNVLRQVRAGLPRNDGELAHAATVTTVAESASGRWIATGSADGVVKIWDAATLTLFLEKRTGGKVEALAFGADESWLAAASGDSKVAVWELASGGTLAGLETQEPVIKLLVQSDDSGTSLVGLSREMSHGHLYAWSARDWSLSWSLAKVRDVAGQRQQQVIALAGGDHIAIVHTQSGELLAQFPLQATAMAVAWHEALQLFAATTMEGTLWRGFLAAAPDDKVEWRCERVEGSFSPMSPLAFSPTAAWLAVAGGAGLSVLNMENSSALSLPLQGQFEIDFAFSPNGRSLAAVSPEGRAISVWRLPDGRPLSDLAVEDARAARFGTGDRRLISASHDNAARVWELPGGEASLWARDLGATQSFTFSPRGDLVAWLGKVVAANHMVRLNESTLVVMRAADGDVVFSTKHEGLVDGVAFDAESRWVALQSEGVMRVFDVRAGSETSELAATAPAWFAAPPPAEGLLPESLSERDTLQTIWSANRLWLVTRHPGRIRVWDRTSLTELATFPISTDTTGIAISADDRYMAIGGGDGDLQIRALPEGVEIAVFPHDGPVTKFAFSPDGNFMLSAGVDALAIVMWIVSPEILMEDVRRRLDRDLTREEWDLYVGPEPYAETRARASTRVRARVAPAVAITG